MFRVFGPAFLFCFLMWVALHSWQLTASDEKQRVVMETIRLWLKRLSLLFFVLMLLGGTFFTT